MQQPLSFSSRQAPRPGLGSHFHVRESSPYLKARFANRRSLALAASVAASFPTASAAAQGTVPNSLTMSSPMNVATRWPPISARGCAGSAWGEPSTVTIDVANGIATGGNAILTERASIPATANAPPIAPARTANHCVLSYMRSR